MKPYGFIYITTNNINNKKYIGKRKIKNNQGDTKYLGSGELLLKAIKRYGRDNFTREIIDYAYTEEELNEKERCHIAKHNATKSPMFYNIHQGGDGGNTMEGWDEQKRKQFKTKMSKTTSGTNNGMYGKRHQDESRKKMSETKQLNVALGKYSATIQSQEFRNRISQVTKGENNGMYGKRHSDESKLKMSQNRKGLTCGELNGNFGNKGERAKNGKAVYGYEDKEHTKLVKSFNTLQLFLQSYNLKGHGGLMKAIKENKQYKGYYWSRTKNV